MNSFLIVGVGMLVIGIVWVAIEWWKNYDNEMEIHPERAKKKEFTTKQIDKIKSDEYIAGYNDAIKDCGELSNIREEIK